MNHVVIRGTSYPSQRAAARALGVSDTAIGIALERGSLERVGFGRFGNNAHPVTYNGNTYPSQADMGRQLGIKIGQVRKLLGLLRS